MARGDSDEAQLVGMGEMRRPKRLGLWGWRSPARAAEDDPSAPSYRVGQRSREGNWGGTLPLCPFRRGENPWTRTILFGSLFDHQVCHKILHVWKESCHRSSDPWLCATRFGSLFGHRM
jgi:hypothetical protein